MQTNRMRECKTMQRLMMNSWSVLKCNMPYCMADICKWCLVIFLEWCLLLPFKIICILPPPAHPCGKSFPAVKSRQKMSSLLNRVVLLGCASSLHAFDYLFSERNAWAAKLLFCFSWIYHRLLLLLGSFHLWWFCKYTIKMAGCGKAWCYRVVEFWIGRCCQ